MASKGHEPAAAKSGLVRRGEERVQNLSIVKKAESALSD